MFADGEGREFGPEGEVVFRVFFGENEVEGVENVVVGGYVVEANGAMSLEELSS